LEAIRSSENVPPAGSDGPVSAFACTLHSDTRRLAFDASIFPLPLVLDCRLGVSRLRNQASAAVLVSYPFTSNTNPFMLGPGVQSSSFNGSQLSKFLVFDDGFDYVLQAYPSIGSTSPAAALANNSYFNINVTAAPWVLLDLTTLQFEVGKGGNSDPRGYFIRSSVDGFASALFATNLPTGPHMAPALQAIDLSTLPAYQHVSSIDFRFYVWTPIPISQSVDYRLLQLQGSAAVPEPSPLALFAAAAAIFGLYHYRRRCPQESAA
jgi:hypothetical protein